MKRKKTPAAIVVLLLLAAAFHHSQTPPSPGNQAVTVTFDTPINTTTPEQRRERNIRIDPANIPPTAGANVPTEVKKPYLSGRYLVKNITVVDNRTGNALPIQEVDLKPTFDRIARGEKHPHSNDGSVYRNLNRQLPRQSDGYYREYVVPTRGLQGPGPQRLVIGKRGEAYYTWNHYDDFLRVDEGK